MSTRPSSSPTVSDRIGDAGPAATPTTDATDQPIAWLLPRRLLTLVLATVTLAVVTALSLAVGSGEAGLRDALDSVFIGDVSQAAITVRELRMPRTAIGILAGLALGLAGALIQSFTRNPLADPGILGVNAGAALGIVVGALLGIQGMSRSIWMAFLGALIATAIVVGIGMAGRRGPDPIRLTLAGVAIGAVLASITSAISLLKPSIFNVMRYWGAGTLADRPYSTVLVIAPFIIAGVVITVLVAHPLNAIALGEDMAASLGVNLTAVRVAAVIAVTLLAGSATAAAGPIAFVGLMVPHVVRWFVGPDQRWIFAVTLVVAPVLLLVSDILGRVVLPSGELPVGVVTAVVGAPVLIALVRRKRVSGL